MTGTRASIWTAAAVAMALGGTARAGVDWVHLSTGLLDLIDRLGAENTPTGAGVVVATVEAEESPGAWGPDTTETRFEGKTFYHPDVPELPPVSFHATTVAKHQYGNDRSISPGVTEIYLYDALDWSTDGFLQVGGGPLDLPMLPPGSGLKNINCSWIAIFGTTELNNDALRRADWAADYYNLLMTVGVNNGGPAQPLLTFMFNGISVGRMDGGHTYTNTTAPYDGPGRMKPEIVAPLNASSWATPIVNAAGSDLIETARTWPGLASNPEAERSDVLKAVILAGARHEDQHDGVWSNEPAINGPDRGVTTTPIDDVVGVGTVNINRSHMILTGGEQDGSLVPPAEANASWSGWDVMPIEVGQSGFWRFDVPETADEVSILATWHRDLRGETGLFSGWSIADFDLTLWRVSAATGLASLVGDDGLAYFAGGNVVSESAVDNVEHLHLTGLAPGSYVLEVERMDSLTINPPWWEVAVAWLFPEPVLPPEDLNGDGVVNFADLILLLAAWGDCAGCQADFDGSGAVDFADILILLAAWT